MTVTGVGWVYDAAANKIKTHDSTGASSNSGERLF
jgi:hypothetical protein